MSTVPIVERAKTQLILNHPFFASILLKRKMEADPSIPTMCMNGRGLIRYNPEFVEGIRVPEAMFVLAHECMHFMLLHCDKSRQGSRDAKGWNYACDAVINETLVASSVGEFLDGGVRWPGAENMSAEEIYELLPKESGRHPKKPGDDEGGDTSHQGPGGIGDDIDSTELDPAEQAEMEAKTKVELSQAAQAAKQMGKLPAHLARLVEKLLETKTPWQDVLARFMQQSAKNDYSWRKPNRRFIANDIYLPSLDGVSMGEMAVIVDTSGSVDQATLDLFGGEVNNILETCKPERVHVIYCDTVVNRVDEVSADDLPLQLKAVGGGGTNMIVATDWVRDNVLDVSCVVMLTDGYTPWPKHVDFPLLVACTTQVVSPVGETVAITH